MPLRLVKLLVGYTTALLVWVNAVTAATPEGQTRLIYFSSYAEILQNQEAAGLANLAGLLERERAANIDTFFIHGGAAFGPSVFGAMDNGAHMVDILNQIAPDVMGVGKREFSYGYDNFILNAISANFPLVSSNLVDRISGAPIDATYGTALLESSTLKIGVIALTSSNAIEEYGATQAELLETDTAVTQSAQALREQGADAIILLADTDYDDLSPYRESGQVDIIFYTHNFGNPYSLDAQGKVLTEGALNGMVIIVDLSLTTYAEGNKTLVSDAQLLPLADEEPNPAVSLLLEDYLERLDQLLGRTIANIDTGFDTFRNNIRSGENAFANLVADALREHLNADAMLLNAGSIRGNRAYEAGYALNRGDIQRELPFGNKTALLRLKGSDILTALEHGTDCGLRQDGCFLHVSNMSVRFDSSKPNGERLVEVKLAGTPIDPDAYYRIAVSDFMAGGHDGFTELAVADRLYDEGTNRLIWNVVVEHVEQLEALSLQTEGRIQDIANANGGRN